MALKDKKKTRREQEEKTGSEATRALQEQLASEEEKFMNALAEYGGQRPTDDDIAQEGSKLVIPQTMTPATAVEFLEKFIEREEKEHQFDRLYRFRPWDGAAALQRALLKMFGTVGIGKRTQSFFFSHPPEMRTINIGVNDTMQVPWGEISVQMLEGTIYLSTSEHQEYGELFHLFVTCPRKYRHHVEGLFKMVENELESESIYRGKAIDGKDVPEFLDLESVDQHRVIYSDDVIQQLQANIWSLLSHSQTMREMEMPLKRAVLLEGPYGTGKTLAAYLTAQRAVSNGWSFVYCRPGRDSLDEVMSTARLYQPSVVFFEDVDIVAHGDSEKRDAVTRLLDIFDGITAKGTELLCIMTTNHPERIHKAMVRPGRLDAVIHIGSLDTNGIKRMIESSVPVDILDEHIDYEGIGDAMEGYLPAYVKEAIDRTMRYAIARENGRPRKLDTEDFVLAASGLRDQLKLQEEAKEGGLPDPISKSIENTVRSVLESTTGIVPGTKQPLMELKTD